MNKILTFTTLVLILSIVSYFLNVYLVVIHRVKIYIQEQAYHRCLVVFRHLTVLQMTPFTLIWVYWFKITLLASISGVFEVPGVSWNTGWMAGVWFNMFDDTPAISALFPGLELKWFICTLIAYLDNFKRCMCYILQKSSMWPMQLHCDEYEELFIILSHFYARNPFHHFHRQFSYFYSDRYVISHMSRKNRCRSLSKILYRFILYLDACADDDKYNMSCSHQNGCTIR